MGPNNLSTDPALLQVQTAYRAQQQRPQGDLQSANKGRIRELAEEFEAMFLSQMMKPMFEGIDFSGTLRGGHAEDIFQDLLIDEYAKNMMQSGGIGLADTIERQLLALQEA